MRAMLEMPTLGEAQLVSVKDLRRTCLLAESATIIGGIIKYGGWIHGCECCDTRSYVVKSAATTTWFQTPRHTKIYEDNKAAILFSDHPGDHRRSKHIDTRRYFVRDAVLHGDIILEYIPTAERLADRSTKLLSVLNIKSYAWITIYIEVYIYIWLNLI